MRLPTKKSNTELQSTILSRAKNEFFAKNTKFINVRDFFPIDIKILNHSIAQFDQTIFYLISKKYLILKEIPYTAKQLHQRGKNIDGFIAEQYIQNDNTIDKDALFKKYFFIKITGAGLDYLQQINESLSIYGRYRGIIGSIKKFGQTASNVRQAVTIGTTLLVILIVHFTHIDINTLLDNVPALNSIIDIGVLKNFVDVDENDENIALIQNEMLHDNVEVTSMKVQHLDNGGSIYKITTKEAGVHYIEVTESIGAKNVYVVDEDSVKKTIQDQQDSKNSLGDKNSGDGETGQNTGETIRETIRERNIQEQIIIPERTITPPPINQERISEIIQLQGSDNIFQNMHMEIQTAIYRDTSITENEELFRSINR